MEDANKKKKFNIILSLVIFLVIIGVSYALFLITNSTDLFTIGTREINLNFLGGENSIVAKGIPIYDEDVSEEASYMIFSLENTSSVPLYTEIYLDNITMSSDVFISEDFRYSIEEGQGLTEQAFSSDVTDIINGNFSKVNNSDSSNKKLLMVKNIKLDANETRYFKLRIWLSETGEDQGEFQGQTLNARISANGYLEQTTFLASSNTLTLNNTVKNGNISDFKLYGNSVQEGENLFDIGVVSDYTYSAYKPTISGNVISATSASGFSTRAMKNTKYSPGSYSISAKFSHSKRFIIQLYDANEALLDNTTVNISGWTYNSYYKGWYSNNASTTVTIPSSVASWSLGFGFYTGAVGDIASVSDIKLAYTLSPDTPMDIQSVGNLVTDESDSNYGKYEIPVVVSGKNITTAKAVLTGAQEYTETTLDGKNCIKFLGSKTLKNNYYNFKENTQYTLSFDYILKQKQSYAAEGEQVLRIYYTDGTIQVAGSSSTRDVWHHVEVTSQANKTIQTIGVASVNYKSYIYMDIDTFQIEEGTTATTYTPYQKETYSIYLDEPLRAIGEYKDYIDFDKGQVFRNIKETILTGNETLSTLSNISANQFKYNYYSLGEAGLVVNDVSLSSHFELQTNFSYTREGNNKYRIFNSNSNAQTRIVFRLFKNNQIITDVTEVQNHLKNQFNNATPVTFDYAVPAEYNLDSEKSIKLPQIKTLDGTTILSVDTTVSPTSIEGSY